MHPDDGWLRPALAAAHIIAWEWNGETGTVLLAGYAVSFLGIPAGSLAMPDLVGMIAPADLDSVRAQWRYALVGHSMDVECRFRLPDGSERWVSIRGQKRDTQPTLSISGVAQDITERKRSEQEFLAREKQYRRIVETASEAILILDDQSRIVFANPSVSELTGYALPEILGQTSARAVFDQDVPKVQAHFERRRTGAKERYEIRVRRKDGTGIWVDVSSAPMFDEAGQFLGALLLATDITERKAAEKERAHQREALERSNADLQQFAFAASHDLQEPLRTVNSYVQLLSKRYGASLDRDAGEFIEFIHAAVGRMDRLIRDLLAYSRVVQREAPHSEDTPLTAIVQWAMMNLQHSIRESQARILFEDLPTVYGDRTELVQLFQNLLSNAIKYRGTAPPVIEIAAQPAGSEWQISIGDNGMGIAPEYHESIFDLFKRLHGPEYPGTGLGLAICKRIVAKHGGRIWVESREGHGAKFHFTLPA